MIKNIDTRMEEIFQEYTIPQDQFEFLENRLWEISKIIESKVMKSIFSFFATSIVWLIIISPTINKLTIFGLEFEDFNVPILLLPPIASYFYYTILCNIALSGFISSIQEKCYSKKIPKFYEMGISKFIRNPTLINIEDTLRTLTEGNRLIKGFDDTWFVIEVMLFLIVPIPILYIMTYSMLTLNFIGIWPIMSSALVIFLFIRSIFVFIYSWILT